MWVKGNFSNGSPDGAGKLLWKNGASCSGQILGKLCIGIKVDANGNQLNGSFEWRFDHEDHSFSNGKYSM